MIKIINVPSLYSSLIKTVEICKDNINKNVEIVVPDKLSLFMEKFLFEHLNICSSFNIRVNTLNRFAKRSFEIDKSKQISKMGSILLIHKIMNENIEAMKVMNSKAYSFTYAENIFKTLSQFKASKITTDELLKFASSDTLLEGKIKDLGLIYSNYEKEKAGLLDASDVFLLSTFYVAEGNENKDIVFVGFDDFTAIEYGIIERLACVANVYVINNYANNANKHIYNNEIYSQLKNIAYINKLAFEIENNNECAKGLKHFLENNIYAIKHSEYTLNNETIKIFSANNFINEMEFVARDIRNKILNGARYDDFGIAVFGLDNHTNQIKRILEKYEINFYLDTELQINNSILYKFFVSILKYNIEGYGLTTLIDIINSPFFIMEEQLKREIIENLILVDFKGKVASNFVLNNIDGKTLNMFKDFILSIQFDKDINVQKLIGLFKDIVEKYHITQVINEIATNDIKDKILLTKSMDVIFTLFDDIVKFNSEIDVEQFYDIFVSASQVLKISNLPLSLDIVKVVDANNTMEVFKYFYIVNVTSDNAPNMKYDCGIILDEEIGKLNFNNKLGPTIAHINRLSKLRLFNTLMLFENELIITYSNNPSEIVKELTNKINVKTKVGDIKIVPIVERNLDKYIALSKWDYIEFATKNNKNTENNSINAENIIKNKQLTNIFEHNLKVYDNLKTVSATILENYFKCPFYMFLTNILKIKPRLKTEILSLDVGNMLHEIMFKYYKNKKNVGEIYDFCKDEIFKFVEKNDRLKPNIKSPILINLIDECVRVINAINYIDENSLFAPKYFEKEFSGKDALQLKNIQIIGKVDRVDIYNDMFRIIDYKSGKADASLMELFYGNKLQLFLYSIAMENILSKTSVGSFYLPLHNAYVKELGNTYSLKGFYLAEDYVVRAFDKRLQPGEKSDIVNVKINKSNTVAKTIGYKELNFSELNLLKNYSIKVSENAVDEIKSGYIAPNPSDINKPCDYCPYVHICMRNTCGVKYRLTNKVTLESFKEVQDE